MNKHELKLVAEKYPLSKSVLRLNGPLESRVCKQCGAEFASYPCHQRKFCSLSCAYENKDRVAHVKPKDRGDSICENCGKTFKVTRNHLTKRFCSHPCASSFVGKKTLKLNRRVQVKPEMECLACKKIFRSSPSSRRKFCSMACSTSAAKSNTRFKHGWIQVGEQRIFVRSSWEANYAFYLEFQKNNQLIVKWEYEPETFWFEGIRRGTCSYLPDFRVTLPDGSVEYHEVKGWLDERSITKLKRMAKYHPSVKVVLIDVDRYRALSRTVSSVVPGWIKSK